jgi:hypothetical protein
MYDRDVVPDEYYNNDLGFYAQRNGQSFPRKHRAPYHS